MFNNYITCISKIIIINRFFQSYSHTPIFGLPFCRFFIIVILSILFSVIHFHSNLSFSLSRPLMLYLFISLKFKDSLYYYEIGFLI